MSFGAVRLSDSATGAAIGEVQGVVADFGARDAELHDLPSVRTSPAMAETEIVNGEVRGSVAVIERGAVPLVEKARRAQAAGAAAVVIVNTDERPLLAHGHRHRDGTHDLGLDIQIPVLVVAQSAGSKFGDGTAGVSVHVQYHVAAASPNVGDHHGTGVAQQPWLPTGSSTADGSAMEDPALSTAPQHQPPQQYSAPVPYAASAEPYRAPGQQHGTPSRQYAVLPHHQQHVAYAPQHAVPDANCSHSFPTQQLSLPEGVPGSSRQCAVVFEQPGPLGMYFMRGGSLARPRVQVQRLGDNAPRVARENVSPGMQLVAIEHEDVTNYSYDAVIDMLQNASRPLRLIFGEANELSLETAPAPMPEPVSVKEQIKAEIERALACSRKELEQTQAEALAHIQLEADNRIAAAEARAAEAERQVEEHTLARQQEQLDHKLALQSERADLQAEHEAAMAKVRSDADSRVAESEAAVESARAELDLEQQRIDQEHQRAVARVQSEADGRIAAMEDSMREASGNSQTEHRLALEASHEALARVQSEADGRIAAMENLMREASGNSQTEHRLALEASHEALRQAHSDDLARIQMEVDARLEAAETRAAVAEREAQEHQYACHAANEELAEMKQQVETRLQEAVEASRAELEEAHAAMLRVHTKAEAPGAVMVMDGLFMGGDFEWLKAVIEEGKVDESELRFFIGYAGWTPGQLESEIKSHSWFVTETTIENIMDTRVEEETLWKQLIEDMGAGFGHIANAPSDPSLN